MPHAPEPDEEGLDALRPPQPVYYAEQALLGALLLEPDRLGDVPGIGPEMFSTAAHSALFAAIRALPPPDPAEHAQSTAWLDQVLSTAREQARGLTASHLHGLIHHCPWPRHATAYAQMVEAEHVRRTLRTHAQRLAHTATDRTLPKPVDTTLAEADTLTSLVDDIAARLPPHSSLLPRTPATVPTTAPDDAKEAIDEERLLLATATAHPGDVEQMRWLAAEDFARPLHAGHPVEGLWPPVRRADQANTPFTGLGHLLRTLRRSLRGLQDRGEVIDGCLAATGLRLGTGGSP
ncbi:DnaB-like helicase N-terminal domain-containing protein [Streptomyces atacamensis]|uniref:DnaB-like helicase N-terminal domain-containing protein n=1 Tax=Streptomyces atacamensis TaxID=531966 RepID=UPI00399D07D6